MSINDFILTCLAPFLENLNKEELCFLMVDFNIDLMKMDSTYLFIYLFIYLLICSLLKIDLHLAYKKPINDNKNTANISANKLSNNNDNNKTKYLIIRRNMHVANRLYIRLCAIMDNQASTFLFFV